MQDKIKELIKEAIKNLGIDSGVDFVVEHPTDLAMGDYSTNVAMVLAKKLKTNPKELAERIVATSAEIFTNEDDFSLVKISAEVAGGEISKIPLGEKSSSFSGIFGNFAKIESAGAGFINFYLKREFFTDSVREILAQDKAWGKNNILSGKKVMVEYTQPNPFKPFHIGHLMSNTIGESLSRIVEFSGAHTVRANYQGDVGPHVAKAIYGLMKFGMPESGKSVAEQAQYIGECYSKASSLYDADIQAKGEIDEINKKIYDRSDEEINKIYDWGRKVTLEAFEEIYKILGTRFDYYFFESEMAPIGARIVEENVGNVFEESEGAIVFKAEKYDPKLHTRVFITSKGLPLYETKELGLTMTKFQKENPDISIVDTAIEQGEYMKVVQKAISLMQPELEKRMKHVTHGMMRLASGKMSSRLGNIVTGESLLRDSMYIVNEKIKEREWSEAEKKKIGEVVGVSALKYSILRSGVGADIVYDFEKSISFEGDSGPYLQYATVRAGSILKKAGDVKNFIDAPLDISELEKTLYRFPEVVAYAYEELEPHYIATYLTELASSFNSFYANTQILNAEDRYSLYYLALTRAFQTTMQNGLWLLGIETPEKM